MTALLPLEASTTSGARPSTQPSFRVVPALLLAASTLTAPGVVEVGGVFAEPDTTSGWGINASRAHLSGAVISLKARSGLTWGELARLFGVSRRSVHNWATGGRMNAKHAERLDVLASAIDEHEAPEEVRVRLMTPGDDGATLFRKLVSEVAVPSRRSTVHPVDALTKSEDVLRLPGDVRKSRPLNSRRG